MEQRNRKGTTALGAAAWNGRVEAVRWLLAEGADPNGVGLLGSPLSFAVRQGVVDVVDLLLSSPTVSVNLPDSDGETALIECLEAKHKAVFVIADRLLKAGADIEALNRRGWTPLMEACAYDRVDVVGYLLSRGANVRFVNREGESCYAKAAQRGFVRVLLQLEEAGGRTTFRLNRPPFRDPSLTAKQRWALACGAQNIQYNGDSHELLTGEPPTPAAMEHERQLLANSWGIRNADDLRSTIRWLRESGHRSEVKIFAAGLAPYVLEVEARGGLEAYCKSIQAAHGERAALGWDFARAINLARWGCLAGYISEEEAWGIILPISRQIQSAFRGWEEFGQSVLRGRRYWRWGREDGLTESMEFITRALLDPGDPESVWNRNPWATELW